MLSYYIENQLVTQDSQTLSLFVIDAYNEMRVPDTDLSHNSNQYGYTSSQLIASVSSIQTISICLDHIIVLLSTNIGQFDSSKGFSQMKQVGHNFSLRLFPGVKFPLSNPAADPPWKWYILLIQGVQPCQDHGSIVEQYLVQLYSMEQIATRIYIRQCSLHTRIILICQI